MPDVKVRLEISATMKDRRKGFNGRKLYITNKGILTVEEVGAYVGVGANSIFQRIRKYGLTSPEVTKPPGKNKGGNRTRNRGDWQGLGTEPRGRGI